MPARIDNESGPSSPASSPLSSLRSSSLVPVSQPLKQRPERQSRKKRKQNSVASYGLRPRGLKREEPDENRSIETQATGHFSSTETKVLQDAFNNGVWRPGNVTVGSLRKELKDRDGKHRSEKQIRDWFSHQRRRYRESGKTLSGEDLSSAVEGLLLLSRQPMQAKAN